VLVPKFGAQVVTVERETFIVASENDVLGILNKKENE
jgi:co-chaperonin GroES (HSP10)